MNYYEQYYQLRADIDATITKLEQTHANKMQCKQGCDSCCESIRVFPIEFNAIKKEQECYEKTPYKFKHGITKKCRFLKKGVCQIYNSRPIICRTQGLPLLYENAIGNAYELSVCKLNFKGIEPSFFNLENALFMPPFNSRLFLLNQAYVNSLTHSTYKNTDRIKFNKL